MYVALSCVIWGGREVIWCLSSDRLNNVDNSAYCASNKIRNKNSFRRRKGSRSLHSLKQTFLQSTKVCCSPWNAWIFLDGALLVMGALKSFFAWMTHSLRAQIVFAFLSCFRVCLIQTLPIGLAQQSNPTNCTQFHFLPRFSHIP